MVSVSPPTKQGAAAASAWPLAETLFAVVLVGIVWAVAGIRWVAPDFVVPWDSKLQFYVFWRFLADAWAAGEFPTWNPYQYAGLPFVADPQSLFFDPVFHAAAWLGVPPTLRAFDTLVYLHILVGGLGMVGLVRLMGGHALGGILAAVVFMLGGSVMARLNHTGLVTSYGLLPVALLFLWFALRRRSMLGSIAFAVVAAMMVVGRNQVAYLGALLLVGAAIAEIMRAAHPGRYLLSRLPHFMVMALVGAALLAVPVLLTVQLAQASNRPSFDYSLAMAGSLFPVNLATLFVPDVFQSMDDQRYFGPHAPTRPWVDTTDRTINYLFLGTAPILLIWWHGIAGGRLWQPGRRFITVALIVALAYALGRFGGLLPVLYEWFPGIKLYRRPADATFIACGLAALLAGLLLSDFVRDGAPQPTRIGTFVSLSALIAILASAVWFATRSDQATTAALTIALALIVIGAASALLFVARSVEGRMVVATAAIVLTSAELILRNAGNTMNAEPRSNYAVLENPTGADAATLKALEAELSRRHAEGDRPRLEILGLGGPWQNVAMARRIEAINGYNPLRLAEMEVLVEPGQNSHDSRLRAFPRAFAGYGSDLAKLYGLGYVLTDRPLIDLPQGAPQPVTTILSAAPGQLLQALDGALPRARIAPQVIRYQRPQVFEDRQLPGPPTLGATWIEAETLLTDAYADPPPPAGPETRGARIGHYGLDEIVIAARTDVPAILVLTDPFYPGWQVTVNGERRPLLRADILFRGVELPPGAHEVRFQFRPFSRENLTAALSLIGKRQPPPLELDSQMKPPQGYPPVYP